VATSIGPTIGAPVVDVPLALALVEDDVLAAASTAAGVLRHPSAIIITIAAHHACRFVHLAT
jgi:hypothetical protein